MESKWVILHVSIHAKEEKKKDFLVVLESFQQARFLSSVTAIPKLRIMTNSDWHWQVLSTESMLFQEKRVPWHPEQCILPKILDHRLLGKDSA